MLQTEDKDTSVNFPFHFIPIVDRVVEAVRDSPGFMEYWLCGNKIYKTGQINKSGS